MGSSDRPPPRVSAEFISLFKARTERGPLSFAEFMELALYHPQLGYYRANRPRVGYGSGTDFFTASTSGPVFGQLVSAACVSILGARNLQEFTFVEIGSETAGGILHDVQHPFGAVKVVHAG